MNAATSQTESTPMGAFAALANRVFARYISALTLSMVGIWIRITAMGFLVYDITGDPFKLGLISFAQSAPQVLVSPIAGAFLDRLNRRYVLLAVQATLVTMMTLLTVLVATDRVTYEALLVIAVIVGSTMAFDWPARLSMVPALVERERLPSAVALNAAAFNGARVVGPTIAGWLIAGAGMAFCFGFTAASSIPFILVLLTLSLRPTRTAATTPRQKPLESLIDGYRYVWNDEKLRAMLSVDLIPIVLGMSYVAMAPAIASDVLGLGSKGFGYLLTVSGVGSLAGTLLVARISSRPNRGKMVLAAVTSFAVLIVFFGLSGTVWLSFPLIGLLSLSYAMSSTLNDTLIQLHADDAYRGRVMAVYSTFWGLSPAGGLLAGYLANHIGVQWAVAINGLLVLAYIPYLLFFTPMRHVD